MELVNELDFRKALARLGDYPYIVGIRHHSPACARMVVEAAEALNVQAIAVELPADLADCVQWIAHEETKPPIAIAAAVAGRLNSGVLYPFAEFSPELAIMRWALAHNIPIYPIDLPVGAPIDTAAGLVELDGFTELSQSSEIISQETWDTCVETRAVGQSWEAIRTAALAVGVATRLIERPDLRTVRRERYMRHALKSVPERTLIVVGSYHCKGLLADDGDSIDSLADCDTVTTSIVPYSYAQLDSRSGYGAGIRDPWWQQEVLGASKEEITQLVYEVMVKITRQLRAQGHAAGTGETIEAVRVACDLAGLRQLPSVGRREVIEAVTTVFAHGEIMGRGRAVARALEKVLVGNVLGKVAPGTPTPALVEETKRQLEKVKLPADISAPTKTFRLDPFSGPTALKRHVLLNQLKALKIPYVVEKTVGYNRGFKSQGYKVSCTWSPSAETAVNLAAAHGVTLAQAVTHRIFVQLQGMDLTLEKIVGALETAIGCGLDLVVRHIVGALGTSWLQQLSLHHAVTVAETLSGVVSSTDAGALMLEESTKEQCVALSQELVPIIIASIEGIAGSSDPNDARALGQLMSFGGEYEGALSYALRRMKTKGSDLMQGAAYALAPEKNTSAMVGSWVDRASKPKLIGFFAALGSAWPESPLLEEFIHNIETLPDATFVAHLPNYRAVFDHTSPVDREAFLDRLEERLGSIHTEFSSGLSPEDALEFAQSDANARKLLKTLGLMDLSFDPATRWRLVLGAQPDQLEGNARTMAATLDELYGSSPEEIFGGDGRVRAGNKPGTITAREWKQDIELLFGDEGVQEIFADALEAGRSDVVVHLDADSVVPSVETLQTILNIKGALPEARVAKLRPVVEKIVKELSEQLASQIRPALSKLTAAKVGSKKSARLALPATIRANVKNVVEIDGRPSIVPVNPKFFQTQKKISPWHVIVVVDVSGSMERSTIFAAMTTAILTQIRTMKVTFITFDTEVVDLSDHADDPLSLLLEISVGGGTNIARALRYAENRVSNPSRTAVILVTDFEEFGPTNPLVDAIRRLHSSGVRLMGCAALDDSGQATYNEAIVKQVVSAGMRVAQVTPLELARWVTEVLK
ncbi:MAG: DUF5682 family protein [Corynebacterium sp.]|uniref:DUF5682 family protein n=1 Tax=Corynebacterium sp. TaxID=1720 RepID=UPI0026DD751B|nr:DUF5682 family protein [Corynebacterium sp.]MDO4761289.1 DUF5682 family protein [Corynebacterium sp.]